MDWRLKIFKKFVWEKEEVTNWGPHELGESHELGISRTGGGLHERVCVSLSLLRTGVFTNWGVWRTGGESHELEKSHELGVSRTGGVSRTVGILRKGGCVCLTNWGTCELGVSHELGGLTNWEVSRTGDTHVLRGGASRTEGSYELGGLTNWRMSQTEGSQELGGSHELRVSRTEGSHERWTPSLLPR